MTRTVSQSAKLGTWSDNACVGIYGRQDLVPIPHVHRTGYSGNPLICISLVPRPFLSPKKKKHEKIGRKGLGKWPTPRRSTGISFSADN